MTLDQLRNDLAEIIASATDVQVFPYLAPRIAPPVALVTPSNPYIESDEQAALGELVVNFRVDISSAVQSNVEETNALDELIELALGGLMGSVFLVKTVSPPYGLQIGTATYLSATIEVAVYNRF